MNRLKLYRRLRGGVWVKYFDKRNHGMEYWKRYKTIEQAYNDSKLLQMHMREPYLFEYYGEFPWGDLQYAVYMVKLITEKYGVGSLSDGYHTFNELYLHRNRLFIALLHIFKEAQFREAWKTKLSADGFEQGDWFIAGLGPGYISYHLPMELWDDLDVKEIPRSLWDGHNHYDVAKRLKGIEQIGSYAIINVNKDLCKPTGKSMQSYRHDQIEDMGDNSRL